MIKKQSDAFEQQIHRLYELVESSTAEVIWNDHIPDPDNPKQSRQIDISIRRDGALTHVECRSHKSRQDVQWIEELIGRRVSLQASSVIAVSSSGFTDGAIKKAKAHGIILRDLQVLTPQEVSNWGRTMELKAYYYQYENLRLSLFFRVASIPQLDMNRLAEELKAYPGRQSLFNASAQELSKVNLLAEENKGKHLPFKMMLRLEGFQLCGEAVEEVEFSGYAHLIEIVVTLPVTFAYGEPEQEPINRNVVMQHASAGEAGFIIHNSEYVATIVDLSSLDLPPNSQFRFVRVSASQEMDMTSFELIGVERLAYVGGPMAVDVIGITA